MKKLNDINLYYAMIDIDGTIKDLVKESTNALEKAMEHMGRVNHKKRGKFVLCLNRIGMYFVKLGILPTNKFMQNILLSIYSLLLLKKPKKFISQYFEEYNKEEIFFEDAENMIVTVYNKDLVVYMVSKNMQNSRIMDENRIPTESNSFLKYVSKIHIGEKAAIKYYLYRAFMRSRNIYDNEAIIIGDNFIDDVLPALLLGTKVVWCNKYNSKVKKGIISALKLFNKKVLDESQIKDI